MGSLKTVHTVEHGLFSEHHECDICFLADLTDADTAGNIMGYGSHCILRRYIVVHSRFSLNIRRMNKSKGTIKHTT